MTIEAHEVRALVHAVLLVESVIRDSEQGKNPGAIAVFAGLALADALPIAKKFEERLKAFTETESKSKPPPTPIAGPGRRR